MNTSPITVIGNLTADPEATFTTSGQMKLTFTVAASHIWYDNDGAKQEKTSFFNVAAWRYVAENAAKTLEKGIGVIVYGRLEQRSYEDKEGNNRSFIELVAEEVGISTRSIEEVTRRTSSGNTQQGGQQRPQGNQQRRQRPATPAGVGASTIPGMDSSEEPF
jgi:single-strand DNA-binding protein